MTSPVGREKSAGKLGSPQGRIRRVRPMTINTDSRQARVEPGLVQRMFSEGEELCKAGQYDAAEEKWKQVLQLDQNDTRTLLHYAVMLRDKVPEWKKDPERVSQLLQQAMGESHIFVSCGLTSPAKASELAKQPKIASPKKDVEQFHRRLQALRSKVEFVDLKTLRRQIAAMETSKSPQDEEDNDWNEEEEHDSFSPLNSKLNARSTVTQNTQSVGDSRSQKGGGSGNEGDDTGGPKVGEHPSVSPES